MALFQILSLWKFFGHVGASEQIRRNHVEKGFIDEVLANLTLPIIFSNDHRHHNFGSWCEGTTTKGLASDVDKVYYHPECPAVEQLSTEFLHSCLIVNDGTTKPGYVKLQLVIKGIPLISIIGEQNTSTVTDELGRVFVCNNRPWERIDEIPELGLRQERKGAAISSFGCAEMQDLDTVFAFRCYNVPSFTSGWTHRPRTYDWPSKQQLVKMSEFGCFLVGKGHPSSQTEHIEWRISFSLQERELMFSLNSTQHKCYILLKMIKQYLITKLKVQSVSSYHLKTALFYTIENNPTNIWIPDKILYCTELCLEQLLDWLNKENCPNFFVPEENMFDRLSSDVMKMTAKLIQDMLDSDGEYLLLLTCDQFGELLQGTLSGKVLKTFSQDAIEFDLKSKLDLSMRSIYAANRLTNLANRKCASETLSALNLLLEHLRKSGEKLLSENVFREIEQGIDILLPTIHLQIAQTIAALTLTLTDADKKRELMRDFDHHIEQTNGFDVMSQKLIKASLLLKENRLEECARILHDCELSPENFLISTCSCRHTTYKPYELEEWIEIGNTVSVPPLFFHRIYVTSCLTFLPCQSDLTPLQLHYEMYRSVGTNTDFLPPIQHSWLRVIAIDTKVYLFFLQYLVYLKSDKQGLATRTLLKLITFMNEILFKKEQIGHKRLMGHLETDLNVLGSISKHSNLELAIGCFIRSWRIQRDYNAAKWHMLVMTYEQYIQRSKR